MTRQEMCEMPVTLNGRPARITGARCDFARVVDLESGLSAEWAWPTVERILDKEGAFHS